jgi:hypothetical protein
MTFLKKCFKKVSELLKKKSWLKTMIFIEVFFFVFINFANQFFKVCSSPFYQLDASGCSEYVSLLEFFGPNYKYYLLNLFLIIIILITVTYLLGKLSTLKTVKKSSFLKVVLFELWIVVLYFPLAMIYYVIGFIGRYCEKGLCSSFSLWTWAYDMFYYPVYVFIKDDRYVLFAIPFIILIFYKLIRFVSFSEDLKKANIVNFFSKLSGKLDFFKAVASIELVLFGIAILLSHIKGTCYGPYCRIHDTIFEYMGAGYFLYLLELVVIIALSLLVTKLLVNFTKKVLVGRLYFAILKVQVWLLFIFVFTCNLALVLVYDGTSSLSTSASKATLFDTFVSSYDLLISYFPLWSELLPYYIIIPNLAFLIFVFCRFLVRNKSILNKKPMISKLLKKYGRLRNIIFIELVAFVAVFIKMHTNELCVRTTVDSPNHCLEHASFFANFNWEYLYLVLGFVFIVGYVFGLTVLIYKFLQFAFKQKKLIYKILSIEFLLFCLGVFVLALFFVYSFSGNQCSSANCNVYSLWTEIVYLNFAIIGILFLPPIAKAIFFPPLVVGLYLDYVKEPFRNNLIEISVITISIFGFYLLRFDLKTLFVIPLLICVYFYRKNKLAKSKK